MKVVLFCGGMGTRLREFSDTIPKPLVPIGPRPIIWHLMKFYAHFGHTEFVLCLGYRGELIRQFFLDYQPEFSGNFTLSGGKTSLHKPSSDVPDWTIHFVDTGLESNIGQRLSAVREFVNDDEIFLANYSDQLSDLNLNDMLKDFSNSEAQATFVAVKPSQSFHLVRLDEESKVFQLQSVYETETRINGGFMALRPSVFEHMKEGEELVEQPFSRLISAEKLIAMKYDGFWKSMDTYKDKLEYDSLFTRGECPWMVWER